MRRFILFFITLVLAGSAKSSAQATSPLTPGTRIRIRESASGVKATHAGLLVAVTADTVTLQPEHRADTLRVSLASVSTLEVSRGRKSRTAAGIGYGALAGVATGALATLIGCEIASSGGGSGCHNPLTYDQSDDATGLAVVAGAVLGGFVGSVVGGIIGATKSGERWEQVAPDRWDLSVFPRLDDGLALTVSIPF